MLETVSWLAQTGKLFIHHFLVSNLNYIIAVILFLRTHAVSGKSRKEFTVLLIVVLVAVFLNLVWAEYHSVSEWLTLIRVCNSVAWST